MIPVANQAINTFFGCRNGVYTRLEIAKWKHIDIKNDKQQDVIISGN